MTILPIMRAAEGTTQSVAIGASSAQSAVLGGSTGYVRLLATSLCHIRTGSNPTATTSHMPLAANVPEYFAVTPGVKIAVIQNASSGTLYITEVTT